MTNQIDQLDTDVREQVRQRYAAAATAVATTGRDALAVVDADQCCTPTASPAAAFEAVNASDSCCSSTAEVEPTFGSALYSADEHSELPAEAVAASLGCGNPMAVAELRAGEKVLDLGSGGGIDVLLSAKRVGPTGFAYGVDMTDEMLDLARGNATKAQATNVEFLKGTIEDVPLPDAAVDVVISNCVINLSTDKPAVLAEMFRVLTPGGRIGISDVVAEDHLTPQMRAERGSYVGCIAGALSKTEYLEGLAAVGFTGAEVEFTHEAAPGMHGAIVRATKPVTAAAATSPAVQPPTAAAAVAGTRTVEVFEPALCCNTGVCGDDVDQALVGFSADLDWAAAQGGRVERHNLANDPLAFANNDTVKAFLQLSGSAGLPLVLVDGVTALTGTYPDRAQLARWAGIDTLTDSTGSSTAAAASAVPNGVQLLGLADAGGCCSTDDTTAGGCC